MRTRQRLNENSLDCSIEFKYGELEESPLFKGDFGSCLRDAVNNYLRNKIFDMFLVFESMSGEERKVLLERAVFERSFREIAAKIGRDKKTAQSRYADAMIKIKNSPLANVSGERKPKEN